jgi:MFS family permease
MLYGVMGPFAASFMERFGLRRTMVSALALLATGVALTTLMREWWQLVLLWGFVVGAGAGAIANVLGAVVAARWFTAQRGLVVGLLTGSAAAGQLIFLSIFARVTVQFGWRATVLAIAAAAFVLIPLVALLMRERPQGVLNMAGTAGSGWLSDRVDNRILLAVYYSLRGLSLVYLPFSFVSFYGLGVFAVFYGLDWIATVPPTVRLIGTSFGRERSGIVYGWVFAAHQVGASSAAYFAGLMRADLGSYLQAFILSGLICMSAAVMVMFIGVDWRKRRVAEATA